MIYLMFYNNPVVTNQMYDLKEISTFAHGVGPRYDWIFHYKNETFNLDKPSAFVEDAHKHGLAVHPYTLQDDMLIFTGNPIEETMIYLNKQVDGIFTEFPHMTYSVYTQFKGKNRFPQSYLETLQAEEKFLE